MGLFWLKVVCEARISCHEARVHESRAIISWLWNLLTFLNLDPQFTYNVRSLNFRQTEDSFPKSIAKLWLQGHQCATCNQEKKFVSRLGFGTRFLHAQSGLYVMTRKPKPTTNKSRKNLILPPRKSKKKIFNHRPFISGCICSGTPSCDLPTPNFAGSSNLNSVPGSGPGTKSKRFRCFRNGRG